MTAALERRQLLDAIQGRLDVSRLSGDERVGLLERAEPEGVRGVVTERYPELGPYPSSWRASAILVGALTRQATEVLEREGVRCAVLKGVAVASLAWAEADLRPQWDVDLLVAPVDQTRAMEALRASGLATGTKVEGLHWHHAILVAARPPGMPIEIHRELSVDLPVAVKIEELLARRIRVRTADGEVPTLCHEDAVVYLGLHSSVHAMERLQWTVDLEGYARRQSVDWMVAARRAREWNVALAVEVAWRYAVQSLGATIPASALGSLGVPWVRRAFSDALLSAARRATGAVRQALERAFRLSLLPTAPALARTVGRKLEARAEARAAASRRGS